jgi:autotransporter-associated beta strand protein
MPVHPFARSICPALRQQLRWRRLSCGLFLLLVFCAFSATGAPLSETIGDRTTKVPGTGIVTRPDASTSWKDSGFTDSNWSVGANWFSGSAPGLANSSGGSSDTATFLGSHNLIVTVDAARSIGSIYFNGASTGAFTLQGGSLYLLFNGEIWIKTGVTNSQTINTPINLTQLGTASVNSYLINQSTEPGVTLNVTGPITGRQPAGLVTTLMLDGYGNGVVSGVISDGSAGGKVALTKDDLLNGSGPDTWSLTGANTYTGATTITRGTLQLGNGGSTGSLSTVSTITNNSVLALNRSNAVTQGVDFSAAAITGTGQVRKLGSGTLTFTAANTYSGGTTVEAGRLLVNNASGSGTGSGTVTVSNTGTVLGGTGMISGGVTVESGAILQAGAGSASGGLTLNGALSLSSGSKIQLALGPGGTHSTVRRTGSNTWSFANNQAFTFIDLGATTATYQDIITGIADPPSENLWTITNGGWIGTFTYDGANIDLTLTAVPEPSTWAGAALALGAVVWTQRRRFARRAVAAPIA